MKSLWRSFLAGSILSIPALLLLAFAILSYRQEYFFSMYAIAWSVFWIASFFAGFMIAHFMPPGASRWRKVLLFFIGGLLAWVLSLAVLGASSLTPLCVGQDNGDGNNDIFLCLFQTALVSLVYTPPALLSLSVAAFIASFVLPDRSQTAEAI